MKDGLQSLTPKQYGYEVCTRAYDRLSAYKDGSYSLIQRAADMPQKAAPAKQPKASREQKPLDAAQSARGGKEPEPQNGKSGRTGTAFL